MLRNIGEMRHRIIIQRREPDAVDEKGYPAGNWLDVCKLWAFREDVSGREFFNAASTQMEAVVTFTVHWHDGLDTSMRIVHKGEIFEIIHIGGGRNVGDFLIIRTKKQEKECKAHGAG